MQFMCFAALSFGGQQDYTQTNSHTYTQTCMYTHAHMNTCMYKHTHTHTCRCTQKDIHTAHTHNACVHLHLNTLEIEHVHTNPHMHTHTLSYTLTHTHTHAHRISILTEHPVEILCKIQNMPGKFYCNLSCSFVSQFIFTAERSMHSFLHLSNTIHAVFNLCKMSLSFERTDLGK